MWQREGDQVVDFHIGCSWSVNGKPYGVGRTITDTLQNIMDGVAEEYAREMKDIALRDIEETLRLEREAQHGTGAVQHLNDGPDLRP